ncbi:MAG: peptide ABC transporter substrate-binding protein [Dehalococcoidia bacterium]
MASIEPASLDPHFSIFAQDISLERMLWRGLYTLDKDNKPQPAMAADMPEISQDGKTYTVRLREDLKWSDGDDLTAEDFVMGVKRTCNPDIAGGYEYLIDAVIVGCADYFAAFGTGEEPKRPTPEELNALEGAVRVRAVDELTIEYQLTEPIPTFTIILSMWLAFPVPVHLFPNSGDPWPVPASDAPGGLAYNGPYVMTEYQEGDHVALAPNPNWDAPAGVRPTLDQIIIRFIDDFAVANNAFRTGEVDFARVDEAQLAAIEAEFGRTGEFLKVPGPTTWGLYMQQAVKPLDNLNVRLAFARAIDRAELVRVVYGNAHQPTTTWAPHVDGGPIPATFQDIIGFDPEKARENLARAGYPNGEGFPVLSILVRDTPTGKATAEFLQDAFKTVLNVDIDIEVVDGPTGARRFFSQQFDLVPAGFSHDYPDIENWIIGHWQSGSPLNNANCSVAEIDDLTEKARFNPNNDERIQQYLAINRLVVENVCIAPYYHAANNYLIKPNVVGMREFATAQDAMIAGDWAVEYWGRSE